MVRNSGNRVFHGDRSLMMVMKCPISVNIPIPFQGPHSPYFIVGSVLAVREQIRYSKKRSRKRRLKIPHSRRMISVIAQERLLGAALGSTLTGFVVFTQRKSIHKTITDNQSRFYPQSQITEHIPKVEESGIELAHVWNKTVDQVFGPVIKYLGSRGW